MVDRKVLLKVLRTFKSSGFDQTVFLNRNSIVAHVGTYGYQMYVMVNMNGLNIDPTAVESRVLIHVLNALSCKSVDIKNVDGKAIIENGHTVELNTSVVDPEIYSPDVISTIDNLDGLRTPDLHPIATDMYPITTGVLPAVAMLARKASSTGHDEMAALYYNPQTGYAGASDGFSMLSILQDWRNDGEPGAIPAEALTIADKLAPINMYVGKNAKHILVYGKSKDYTFKIMCNHETGLKPMLDDIYRIDSNTHPQVWFQLYKNEVTTLAKMGPDVIVFAEDGNIEFQAGYVDGMERIYVGTLKVGRRADPHTVLRVAFDAKRLEDAIKRIKLESARQTIGIVANQQMTWVVGAFYEQPGVIVRYIQAPMVIGDWKKKSKEEPQKEDQDVGTDSC